MKIPLEFVKNKKHYIFIKQYNDRVLLYDVYSLNKKTFYYKESFSPFDLGLIRSTKIMEGFANNPENVVIL